MQLTVHCKTTSILKQKPLSTSFSFSISIYFSSVFNEHVKVSFEGFVFLIPSAQHCAEPARPTLTRHSSSRAGRAMMIISFFTSCVTKATSELSDRSWACGEHSSTSGPSTELWISLSHMLKAITSSVTNPAAKARLGQGRLSSACSGMPGLFHHIWLTLSCKRYFKGSICIISPINYNRYNVGSVYFLKWAEEYWFFQFYLPHNTDI